MTHVARQYFRKMKDLNVSDFSLSLFDIIQSHNENTAVCEKIPLDQFSKQSLEVRRENMTLIVNTYDFFLYLVFLRDFGSLKF